MRRGEEVQVKERGIITHIFCLFFVVLGSYAFHAACSLINIKPHATFAISIPLTFLLSLLCFGTCYFIQTKEKHMAFIFGNSVFIFLCCYQVSGLYTVENTNPLLIFTIVNSILIQILFNNIMFVRNMIAIKIHTP